MVQVHQELENKRAIVLLRVSTKKQGIENKKSNEIDIPVQRKLSNEVIAKNKMKLVKTFLATESGYKKKSKDRDDIVEILEMAKNEEFDVLVAYRLDRLGRKVDDTPSSIVFPLYEMGKKIITYDEGLIKCDTPLEKVMIVMQFFGAEEYSRSISTRSNDYQCQLVENECRFRGGVVPYGYKLMNLGEMNPKGKPILSMIISEEEAKVVLMIYLMSVNKNMGARNICSYLNKNKIPAPKGGVWYYSTVNNILHNPIYKGVFQMNDKKGKRLIIAKRVNENLIIIPEDLWERTQKSIVLRTKEHNQNKISHPSYGEGLLAGMVFCGSCGDKLSLWTNSKVYKTVDGQSHRSSFKAYKCSRSSYAPNGITCNGKKTYACHIIDQMVEEKIRIFIKEFINRKLPSSYIDGLNKKIKSLIKERNIEQNKIDNAYQELNILKENIALSLLGKSDFTPELLKDAIKTTEDKIKLLLNNIDNIKNEIKIVKSTIDEYKGLNNNLSEWENRYNVATKSEKKMLLSQVIDKVYLWADRYEIINKITIEDFKENSEFIINLN